eukprot:1160551-Pelagomonas_calceolata.AAC.7
MPVSLHRFSHLELVQIHDGLAARQEATSEDALHTMPDLPFICSRLECQCMIPAYCEVICKDLIYTGGALSTMPYLPFICNHLRASAWSL